MNNDLLCNIYHHFKTNTYNAYLTVSSYTPKITLKGAVKAAALGSLLSLGIAAPASSRSSVIQTNPVYPKPNIPTNFSVYPMCSINDFPFQTTILLPTEIQPDLIGTEVKVTEEGESREECHMPGLKRTGDKVNLLSCDLYDRAKQVIDINDYKEMEHSRSGHTAVIFPKDLPVALKHSRGESAELTHKMEKAEQLRTKNGYDHLMIANSAVYKDFVVQSRLPLIKNDRGGLKQIDLYLNHLPLFTDAVKEFTGLLCQCFIGDLDSKIAERVPFETFSSSPIPRFDNLGIILDNNGESSKGKIALVDLDYFSAVPPSRGDTIDTVIRFFPYHFEEILDTAKKFFPDIEKHRSFLETVRDDAKEFYENVYSKHLRWLQSKGIHSLNPLAFQKMSAQRRLEAQEIVHTKIVNELSDYIDILNEDKNDFSLRIKKALPAIFDSVENMIETRLSEGASVVNSNAEFIAQRKPTFTSYFHRTLKNSINFHLGCSEDDYCEIRQSVLIIILNEMVRGGDILYFDKYLSNQYIMFV